MANNLTEMIDKLLAQGLLALRNNNVIPRTVNRDYSTMAAQQGDVINVPIASAITATPVAPANIAPNPGDQTPTSVPITLDQWEEAAFYMTDKDLMELAAGQMPSVASQAVASLIDKIEQNVLSNYAEVFSAVGTAGVTPFDNGSINLANDAGKVLADQKCPVGDRWIALDTAAEAAAKGTRALQDASWRANTNVISNGTIGSALGFGWVMNQNIPVHTAGTAAGWTADGAAAADAATFNITGGSGTFNVGDIVTISGQTQTYAVTGSTGSTLSVTPALRAALSGGETITVTPSHTANLAYHRDAFALASRPLEDLMLASNEGTFASNTDPLSGITLRVEVRREYKRTRFSYDALWGTALVRPELAVRILG